MWDQVAYAIINAISRETPAVEDDGFGVPVNFNEWSLLANEYARAAFTAENRGIPRIPTQQDLDKHIAKAIESRAEDGKVYLSPHFRGFIWGYMDQEIPLNMRPNRFKAKGKLPEETYVRAADRAHQYRVGFNLARYMKMLPLTKAEEQSIQEDRDRVMLKTITLDPIIGQGKSK